MVAASAAEEAAPLQVQATPDDPARHCHMHHRVAMKDIVMLSRVIRFRRQMGKCFIIIISFVALILRAGAELVRGVIFFRCGELAFS